jgi:mono/diheme cytochrome c family protein
VRKRVGLLAALGLALACNPDDAVKKMPNSWFATMSRSPAPRPYAEPRQPVAGAVPVPGREVMTMTAAEADRLRNPRARTAESLNHGQSLYETFCSVCHGPVGRGDGPISAGNGQTPPGPFPGIPTLVDDARRRLSDGWIYGVVVNAQDMGKGLMPRYGDKIRGQARWDLVNFVRQLQADAGGVLAR